MKLDSNFIAFCKQSIALEQRMAKQAGKRLNEAMRNNIQDINVLDRIADQLLDTMSGLSGAGERTYMKYIKYLGTFNPQAAKETKDAYEDNGNVIGVKYSDDDKKLASTFEKLDFNEKLDVFSEIIIRYDNETYFTNEITMISFDSNSNGFDLVKKIQDFKE